MCTLWWKMFRKSPKMMSRCPLIIMVVKAKAKEKAKVVAKNFRDKMWTPRSSMPPSNASFVEERDITTQNVGTNFRINGQKGGGPPLPHTKNQPPPRITKVVTRKKNGHKIKVQNHKVSRTIQKKERPKYFCCVGVPCQPLLM